MSLKLSSRARILLAGNCRHIFTLGAISYIRPNLIDISTDIIRGSPRNRPAMVVCDSPQLPIQRTRLKDIFALVTLISLETLGYGLALVTKAVRALFSSRLHVLSWTFSAFP